MSTINKEILEEKLKAFTAQYKKVVEEINSHMVLSQKLEGAIEATQILIKELKDSEDKEKGDAEVVSEVEQNK